ncbi:Alkaline-phosphatase-like, core domain,Alkaline phosphatase-like, alpha/beta/alpha,GPI ethanolamine [Cinara cedri]|uniref:GPI ethanolamine phosphate transferase 1 n=1 Tax=Cinara cedri TaxID=506608 RepID=A0A5E4NNQ4_9HEMI|nr:Alkaline-phosphatase-like, core domain,Alkaline phosphatase-like, alpha/beta/alpha,GPI ethanolamine [Cinara cedri]
MASIKIAILGFFAQFILLLSIFDIYFKSPIITGIPDQQIDYEPPADRLVLFVGDGLRADSFYDYVDGDSIYFKNLLKTSATYGICHTRVPTESRPGHIALIAGFYEDPSAIFKGWKENTVEFDSVFNKSDTTISWGSPDIVSMFKRGAKTGNVHTYTYGIDLQDFSGKNGSSFILSEWVFNKVKLFFEESKHNETIRMKLMKNKLILFLHLLGTDVSGHIDKPKSKEYLENIISIEKGIKEIEQLIESFYNDNRTAYIFTSDHGMTDWGSHGDGSDSETEVPIVTWGAGLSYAKKHLTSLPVNIKQADVAPLMATLIGVPTPVHSVGVVPLNLFNTNITEQVKYILANALQVNAAFSTAREKIEQQSFRLFYVPYEQLSPDIQNEYIQNITTLTKELKSDECVKLCYEWIHLSLNGIEYYNTYYKFPLLFCVTFIDLGWITLLITETSSLKSIKRINKFYKLLINVSFLILALSAFVFINAQSLPLQFHVYTLMPLILWRICITRILPHFNLFNIKQFMLHVKGSELLELLFYCIGIELLVWTFFERCVLSFALALMCLWMTYFSLKKGFMYKQVIIVFFSSAWFAYFPMVLIIDGHTNIINVVLGGTVWLAAGLMHCKNLKGIHNITTFLQVVLLAMAIINVTIVSNSIDNKEGLSSINQIISWTISILSMFLIRKSSNLLSNITTVFLSISTPFVQLSLNMEVVFMLVLVVTLACWRKIVTQSSDSSQSLWTQWRHAFFFLLFSFGSFFGIGNIASINSFDPSIGRCFVSVFSPFTIMGLVLFKILVPILLTCCTFYLTSIKLKIPTSNVFALMLAMSNLMGLHFLFLIKNTGSWLDIGMSISHYVIVQSLALFLSLMYGLAGLLIGTEQNYSIYHYTQLLPVTSKKSP